MSDSVLSPSTHRRTWHTVGVHKVFVVNEPILIILVDSYTVQIWGWS